MNKLTLAKLQEAVRSGAAARSRVALQPAGGEGTKIFPPTYAGAVYATERRRLPDYKDPVDCVLLDSVQSQANRMEEALQRAVDDERLNLPVVVVDFTSFDPGSGKDKALQLIEPVGKVTSLQAPHRIADAILRDSVVEEEKKPFRHIKEEKESEVGKELRRVTAQNATALFKLCPTALLLGMWDSTGPKGGLGVKFEWAMVSEVVGINAERGVKTSSRIDPVAIKKDAGPLYRRVDGGYTVDPSLAMDELKDGTPTGKKLLFKPKKTEKGLADVFHTPGEPKYPDQGRPSVANHGNVTPDIDYREDEKGNKIKDEADRFIPVGGFTITAAEQSVVLSFPALRRLRFPVNGKLDPKVDDAARTVLAALGLCAATLAAEAGLGLRSRCLLWPTAPLTWELLGKPGQIEKELTLEADDAIQLFKEAVEIATGKAVGLPWLEKPLRLIPSEELVKLVVVSQRLAQAQGGEGGD